MLKCPMIVLVLLVLVLFSSTLIINAEGEKQLIITVTFSYLEPDVEKLICSGEVYSLVPAGVDPHEYQLRPGDLELLRKSDLIVSTGHTSFEFKIRDLVNSGEISSKLIDLMDLQGIKYLKNPVTGQPNYHMPINDPVNYIIYITSLYETLIEIDPVNLECYTEKYLSVINNIFTNILQYRGTFHGNILIDKPHVQYYAEWLGLGVSWIVKPEEDYQVTPGDLSKLRDLLKHGNIRIVFVTRPGSSPESKLLLELADEGSLPVIWVNNPSNFSGVYDSLLDLLNQVRNITPITPLTAKETSTETRESDVSTHVVASLAIVCYVIGVLSCLILKRTLRR